MEKLKEANYRLWFDWEEIHLGDSSWQARIDRGLEKCDGVILCISPAACQSEPVRYEVRKALEYGKPIFPIILEKVASASTAIKELELPEKQHLEDFTDVTRWKEQVTRLLGDLVTQGLRVTYHDKRQERDPNNPAYTLQQCCLRRLVEQVGTLNLALISPEQARGIYLEEVYVDSPTPLSISVEVQDGQVIDWWLSRPGENYREKLDERAFWWFSNDFLTVFSHSPYIIGE
jgi:hypothetical protein